MACLKKKKKKKKKNFEVSSFVLGESRLFLLTETFLTISSFLFSLTTFGEAADCIAVQILVIRAVYSPCSNGRSLPGVHVQQCAGAVLL